MEFYFFVDLYVRSFTDSALSDTEHIVRECRSD